MAPVVVGGGRRALAALLAAGVASGFSLLGMGMGTTTTKTTTMRKRSGVSSLRMGMYLETDPGGLQFVKLTHRDGSSAKIFLYGADLTSYVDGSGTEWLAVRPDAKMDGSKPISGGASHCFPQFGPGAIQQHGFARNVDWKFAYGDEDQAGTYSSVVLELTPSEYTKAIWDKPFKCLYEVTLASGYLTAKLTVENVGWSEEDLAANKKSSSSFGTSMMSSLADALNPPPSSNDDGSFEFQAALHTYFDVSAISSASVTGSFEGAEYLDKTVDPPAAKKETRAAITVAEPYDRVYLGVNDPVLVDKGKKKKLTIANSAGFKDTVLWSPYGDDAMGFKNFLCVESVAFDPIPLLPGQAWSASTTLVPEPL